VALARLARRAAFFFLDTHVAPDGKSIYTAEELSERRLFEARREELSRRWFRAAGAMCSTSQWSRSRNEPLVLARRAARFIRALYHAGFTRSTSCSMFDIDGGFELRAQYSRLYLSLSGSGEYHQPRAREFQTSA